MASVDFVTSIQPISDKEISIYVIDSETPIVLSFDKELASLSEIIKEIYELDSLTASEFLDICKREKINILDKDFFMIWSDHIEKKVNKDYLNTKEVLKEVTEQTSFSILTNSSVDYVYNDKKKHYTYTVKGKSYKLHRYAINSLQNKIIEKFIRKNMKNSYDKNDFFIYVDNFNLSIYLQDKNIKMYGKPKQQRTEDEVYHEYDIPSVPISLDFIKTGLIDEDMQELIDSQIVKYWNAYKIINPDSIGTGKIEYFSDEERTAYLKSSTKELVDGHLAKKLSSKQAKKNKSSIKSQDS